MLVLVALLVHALLVVAGGLIVGIDDGVAGQAVGAVGIADEVDAIRLKLGEFADGGEHLREGRTVSSCNLRKAQLPDSMQSGLVIGT